MTPAYHSHFSAWRRASIFLALLLLCRALVHALPAQLLALVLLVQPLLERRKVIKDRRCVHLPLAADGFQRVRPGLALAHAEHLVQAVARRLALIDGAAMQRPLLSRSLAQRAMKLELKNARKEIARVRSVGSNVIFGAGIKICFAALHWRRHALVLGLQVPPGFVVLLRRDFTGENFPAPLINQQTKWQEGNLIKGHLEQVACISALRRHS